MIASKKSTGLGKDKLHSNREINKSSFYNTITHRVN